MAAERVSEVYQLPPSEPGIGPLAKALAKAQAAFPTIERTKEVEVRTKTGGSYTFKYAPLDTIFTAVRTPLSANGLAVSQLLDGPDLLTILMHESGASLSGRVPLPHAPGDNVQQLGSAITYLRRYALQAILGIASEEDDDGNAASGNTAKQRKVDRATGEILDQPESQGFFAGEGKLGIGASVGSDGQLRESPTGPFVGFKLKVADGPDIAQVVAYNRLASDFIELADGNLARLLDQHVKVAGELVLVPWEKDGKKMPRFRRLTLSRIESGVGAWSLPAEAAQEPAGAPEPGGEVSDDLEGLDAVWNAPR